ncbi:hypothetical protein GCM10010335_00790 [Streptomyces galbus]|nr:hypothetical protein GCM10010335_00790 [Streptomyces galbus]
MSHDPLIRDVMSTDAVSGEPMTTVERAASLMRNRDVGDVLVAYDSDLFGVLTDRDVVVRVPGSVFLII